MNDESAVFQVLADPTRLRLAILLSIRREICVCELAQALDVPDFKVSRHLRVMRAAGMVEARREGTWMFYRFKDARSAFESRLRDCLRCCLADHPAVRADLDRLAKATCGVCADADGRSAAGHAVSSEVRT